MALADYFHRDALAISQVLTNIDATAIEARLDGRPLAIAFSREAATSGEGAAVVDLAVRLAARLYPAIALQPGEGAAELASNMADLALAINPALDLDAHVEPAVCLVVGHAKASADVAVYIGSDAWRGRVSATESLNVGHSETPFGAGIGACLGLANVFREFFLDDQALDVATELDASPVPDAGPIDMSGLDLGELALIGAGAVGNAAVWALARSTVAGTIHLVDPEVVDLGNLQRYVLTKRSDVSARKVDLAAAALAVSSLAVGKHFVGFDGFASAQGDYRLPTLVAVDSARDRRHVQAALPPWVANAWTQPGDLGVSAHDFIGPGACLHCMYLPTGESPSDDQIYAQALGIPDQLLEVRRLMHQGEGVPLPLLQVIAARSGVDVASLAKFEGVSIRELYVEGICGGGILPLGATGSPRGEVHVPLAHQSALAGVLLAARAVTQTVGIGAGETLVSRVNVMRPLQAEYVTQTSLKDVRGICICQDEDYRAVYMAKYEEFLRS